MNLLLPIIVLFVLAVLIVISTKDKNGNKEQEYDERQKLIAFEGWRRAAITGIVLNMVFGLLFAWMDDLPFDASFILVMNVYISCAVYALYGIFNGSYFGIQNKWKRSLVLFCILAVLDIAAGIFQISTEFSQDGRLTLMNSSTLMLGILFAVIACGILIETFRERKENR